MFILNLQPSTIDFVFSTLKSPSSYIKTPFSNFYSQSSALLFPSSVKSTVYLTQNFPKNSWIYDKMSASAACTSHIFNPFRHGLSDQRLVMGGGLKGLPRYMAVKIIFINFFKHLSLFGYQGLESKSIAPYMKKL